VKALSFVALPLRFLGSSRFFSGIDADRHAVCSISGALRQGKAFPLRQKLPRRRRSRFGRSSFRLLAGDGGFGPRRGCFFRLRCRAGSNAFMDKPILFVSGSTEITLTWTTSPTLTASRGSRINRLDIWLRCTSPSCRTPISTNAPKFVTLVTVPRASCRA